MEITRGITRGKYKGTLQGEITREITRGIARGGTRGGTLIYHINFPRPKRCGLGLKKKCPQPMDLDFNK